MHFSLSNTFFITCFLYKKYYSIETFLTRIKSDIHTNMNNQKIFLLLLLNLRATLDTVDINKYQNQNLKSKNKQAAEIFFLIENLLFIEIVFFFKLTIFIRDNCIEMLQIFIICKCSVVKQLEKEVRYNKLSKVNKHES